MSKVSRQRKTDILRAACCEFQDRGLQETSMADIARRADIGKSTIYEYYPSKDELLREAGRWMLERFLESIHTSFADDAPLAEQLCRYLDSFAQLRHDASAYCRAMENVAQFVRLIGAESLRNEVETFQKASCEIIAAAITRAAGRGEIPQVENADIAAQMLLALLNPLTITQLQRAGLEEAAKAAMQTVLCRLAER